MKNNIAVYPGSFDPITIGHYEIIKRASKLYDQVTVLIMKNVHKNGLFEYSDRKELIEQAVSDLPNVTVEISTGLLVDYLKENNIQIIIKGLRNSKDFEYEFEMDAINHILDPEIELLYLISDPKYIAISSSSVRELINYKADISSCVPKNIIKKIEEITGY